MRKTIAGWLIRTARRISPNSCVDFHPLPTGPAVLNVNTLNVTGNPCPPGSAEQEGLRIANQTIRRIGQAAGHAEGITPR